MLREPGALVNVGTGNCSDVASLDCTRSLESCAGMRQKAAIFAAKTRHASSLVTTPRELKESGVKR